MKYKTTREKFRLLAIVILLYNTVFLSAILYIEIADERQVMNNFKTCLDRPTVEEQHFCFDWAQALTSWSVGPSFVFGGNAAIYALFRHWNTGQHDNQIKRLMGQAYRLRNGKISSHVPIIIDDGWTGVLTHRCRNLYDDYAVDVTKYNKNDLSAEELQQWRICTIPSLCILIVVRSRFNQSPQAAGVNGPHVPSSATVLVPRRGGR